MHFLLRLLRVAFDLLYHQFAWSYDLVSDIVSLGKWQTWVLSSIPYIQGKTILELGYGPGHLQVGLNEKGFQTFGLDESRQMGKNTARTLRRRKMPLRITRGYAQFLPFRQSFHTVVSTFPSEYILDTRTLTEVQRVLLPGGRFVILPFAWLTGQRSLERLAAWLFRITHQVTGKPGELPPAIKEWLVRAGFQVRLETMQVRSSLLIIIVATKV